MDPTQVRKLHVTVEFQKPVLTESEQTSSQILNQLQKTFIKTLQADIANELITLPCTTENAFRDAELQGQLGMLQLLLDCSEEAEDKLRAQVSGSPLFHPVNPGSEMQTIFQTPGNTPGA